MYTFKEDAWLHNGTKDLWYLVYIKKGQLFPGHTTLVAKFSGVWICKKGYSWEFSAYFGRDLKKITKELKAESSTTQVRWPMRRKVKMKLFVYGKLQSTKTKSWLLPFSKTRKHKLYGHRLYLLPKGTAGLVIGDKNDYAKGEIREVKWAVGLLGKLLLFILDLNEGTFWNVYKRTKVKDMWIYLYVVKGGFEGIKIHKW